MTSNPYDDFIEQDFCALSEWLFSLNAYEFSLIATIIGFSISPTLTVNQQNSLGNFFELLGQVILTINAQNATLSQAKAKYSCLKPYIEFSNLNDEIIKIKKEIIQLRKDAMSNYK
ncbi:MAG: hypothetical protein PHE54_05150 [Bacilli bacterium]|nr:hypothetical protein [Bacilli bacterium]